MSAMCSEMYRFAVVACAFIAPLGGQIVGIDPAQVVRIAVAAGMSNGSAAAVLPQVPHERQTAAPLYLRIGEAEFTPGGFIDFVSVTRSTNIGSGIGTSFGSLPFGNTPSGALSESRFSAQNSRLSLKVTSHPHDTDVTGYLEVDFLGMQPGNGYVTSNGNSLRLRLYWANVRKDKWELLGGQSWSLLTPNRVGVSAVPTDIFTSQVVDTNYHIGMPWSRNPQIRVVHHTTDRWTLALSLENPQQYIGPSVVLPTGFPANELDNGNNLSTPALHPDLISKVAYDRRSGRRHVHIELAGLFRSFRVTTAAGDRSYAKSGGGVAVNANVEVKKDLRLIANTFHSSGGGRYIFGLGPDVIVRSDGALSTVRATAAMSGFEYQASPVWSVYTYYGIAYFQRNVTSTNAAIGFGVAAAGTTANRVLEERTVGCTRTFWRKPEYGALQMSAQWSLVNRTPWWTPVGSPREASAHMVFASFRYVLP